MKRKPVEEIIKGAQKVKSSTSKAPKHKALFVFRRDLRVYDNTALLECHKKYNVCPIFLFTPEQVGKNDYKSHNAIQFMVRTLQELRDSIKSLGGYLYTYFGDYEEVLKTLVKENDIKAIYFNKDYSPYAYKRDKKIEELCTDLSIECCSYHDLILNDGFDEVKSKKGDPYYVFNHFYSGSRKLSVRKPDFGVVQFWEKLKKNKYEIDDFRQYLLDNDCYTENPTILMGGGRKEVLEMLEKNAERWAKYGDTRNDLENPKSTTHLSAHNKFGTISVRELYYHFAGAYGDECDLNRQLYWRDFYYYLSHWFPETFEGTPIPSKIKYTNLKWEYDDERLRHWKEGTTGLH